MTGVQTCALPISDDAVNSVTPDGLLLGGGTNLLGDQLVAVGATLVYAFVVTFAITWILNKVIPGGIRVSEEEEASGLDVGQHSETGYQLVER